MIIIVLKNQIIYIEEIINTVIDPPWKSFNYSQIDGNDPNDGMPHVHSLVSKTIHFNVQEALEATEAYIKGTLGTQEM